MTHAELIVESLKSTMEKHFKENKWGARHCAAFKEPQGPEKGIVDLTMAAAHYADYHRARFGSKLGDDSFLGPLWEAIMKSIRGLLNGECGRLDCGTVDKLLLDMLAEEGFSDQ